MSWTLSSEIHIWHSCVGCEILPSVKPVQPPMLHRIITLGKISHFHTKSRISCWVQLPTNPDFVFGCLRKMASALQWRNVGWLITFLLELEKIIWFHLISRRVRHIYIFTKQTKHTFIPWKIQCWGYTKHIWGVLRNCCVRLTVKPAKFVACSMGVSAHLMQATTLATLEPFP